MVCKTELFLAAEGLHNNLGRQLFCNHIETSMCHMVLTPMQKEFTAEFCTFFTRTVLKQSTCSVELEFSLIQNDRKASSKSLRHKLDNFLLILKIFAFFDIFLD